MPIVINQELCSCCNWHCQSAVYIDIEYPYSCACFAVVNCRCHLLSCYSHLFMDMVTSCIVSHHADVVYIVDIDSGYRKVGLEVDKMNPWVWHKFDSLPS